MLELADDLCFGQRLAVHAARGHGLDGIGHGHDPSAEGDRLALEPVRITEPVPALVVMAHDRTHCGKQLERLQEVVSYLGVRPHERPFLGGQRGRLEQHAVGDADLADIVQQRA